MTRPRGGYIGFNRVPAASALNSAASGIWTLREAEALKRAGTWPNSFIDPTSQSGLQLWLDASDASTLYDATTGGSLVAADGGVARWEDKSGNARHMTQSTSANRPARKTAIKNSLDVVRFDGSNDSMAIASSTATFKFLHSADSTVFAVVKRTGGTSGVFLNTSNGGGTSDHGCSYGIQNGSGTNDRVVHNIFRGESGTSSCGNSSANGSVAAAFSAFSFVGRPTSGTASLRSVMRINAGAAISNNTETSAASTANAFANLSVGTDNWSVDPGFCGCDIAELIIYNSALSDANRALVEDYLLAKWGIA